MAKHEVIDPDPEQVEDALQMWANFTALGTYAVYALVVLVAGLALAFVKFI